MGTGSFPGVNRPGRGVDHPSPSSAEVKERAIPLLPHWDFVACYRVNFTFTHCLRAFFLPSEARGLRQVLYSRECSGLAQRGSRPIALATDSRWKTYRACKKHGTVIAAWHFCHWPQCVRCVVCDKPKVQFMHSSLQQKTLCYLALTKRDCTSDTFIFNWSQAKVGRLSPARTSPKVNCKLRSQSVWF